MKHKRTLLILVVLLTMLPLVLASANAGYDLSWWSVDSGGGLSSSGSFSLLGVAGQADAGLLRGGDFSLAGGFLGGAAPPVPPQQYVFLPLIVKPAR